MNSLPVGGITTRTACGTITRRRIWRRDMPSARPATSCPGSTQNGPEVSASQNRWVSKLPSSGGFLLLHVAGRDPVLGGEALHRPVRLQRRDRRLELCAERRVGLAVVDPKRVRLREQVADLDLP